MACVRWDAYRPRVNSLFKILTIIRRWLIRFITQLVTCPHYLSCYPRKHFASEYALLRDNISKNDLSSKHTFNSFYSMFPLSKLRRIDKTIHYSYEI